MVSRTFEGILWVVFVSFAGAASAQEAESDAAAKADKSDAVPAAAETCVDITRAKDINVISDQHVYVRTIGGNQYLLTMAQSCRNLQRSYRSDGVRIQPYGRRICPNDGSYLLYDWFGRESVCPILTIDPVGDRAEAKAIAEGDRSPVAIEDVLLLE